MYGNDDAIDIGYCCGCGAPLLGNEPPTAAYCADCQPDYE